MVLISTFFLEHKKKLKINISFYYSIFKFNIITCTYEKHARLKKYNKYLINRLTGMSVYVNVSIDKIVKTHYYEIMLKFSKYSQ